MNFDCRNVGNRVAIANSAKCRLSMTNWVVAGSHGTNSKRAQRHHHRVQEYARESKVSRATAGLETGMLLSGVRARTRAYS